MINKRVLYILFLLISPIVAKAQVVEGKVVATDGQTLAFANIMLCQDADSTVISGCTSDLEGLFSFECPDKTGKHLKVSYVGYETLEVKIDSSPMTITLRPVMLNEVIVKGYRKLYEQKNGEMIANVKGTILESFPTAKDVIAQLPFVSEQNGDFTVFGKGTPLIYINNRLVQDKEELNRLMSSEIKSIKVNTMPGAKYDATVNSVIQIITERPQGDGLSGSLYAGAKRSRMWSTEEYASLNYRSGAWDVFGSVYWIQGRRKTNMDSYQQLLVSNSTHDITYDIQEKVKSKNLAAVAGINFNPNPNHSAGIQYVYNHLKWKDDMHNYLNYQGDENTEAFKQTSYFDKPNKSHNVNAYYNGAWNNRFAFNLNADWATGDATEKMNSSFADNYAEDINTIGTRKYDLYAAKGVFSYTDNQLLSIDAGAEYAYTDVKQSYNIDNTTVEIENSDDVIKQNRWAMFVSAKIRIGKWGIGAGLRYENIDFGYYNHGEYNKEQSRSYNKLFPNIQANYSYNKLQAVLGYERKIKYPTYGQLRSNVQYSSPFVYESGNPLLQPQIQNDFTGMLTYMQFTVVLGYTIYENHITQLMSLYKDNPIILIRTENVKDVSGGFFAVSYTPIVGFWRPTIEVGGQWQFFELGDGQEYDKPIFKTRWNNSFSLPANWVVNLDARWQSEGNSGMYMMKSFWTVNTRVAKQLFDKKLTVSLAFNDIFKSGKNKWYVNNDLMTFDNDGYNDSRYVHLTVSYNFNATRSKYRGSSATDEIMRL